MMEDIIGYLGGLFIMISFIPQVIKSYKTKSVDDLSIGMILATIIGTIFWITYGVLINSMPIVIMNSIFGVIVLSLILGSVSVFGAATSASGRTQLYFYDIDVTMVNHDPDPAEACTKTRTRRSSMRSRQATDSGSPWSSSSTGALSARRWRRQG